MENMFKIDTIQICVERENLISEEIVIAKKKTYVSKIRPTKDKVYISIQVCKITGKYEQGQDTYTFSYFKEKFNYIIDDLGILDRTKVVVTRIDQCWDYKLDFDTMYKLNNIMTIAYGIKIDADRKDIIERNMILGQIKASLEVKNSGGTKQLYSYNKHIESDGKHLYKTRQELRSKRLHIKGIDFDRIEEVLNSNYKMLDELVDVFTEVEKLQITALHDLYVRELEEKKIHTFYDLVTRYNEQFITRHICEQVYYETGNEKSFDNWLDGYRDKLPIKFMSKHQFKINIKDMKIAFKKYMGL